MNIRKIPCMEKFVEMGCVQSHQKSPAEKMYIAALERSIGRIQESLDGATLKGDLSIVVAAPTPLLANDVRAHFKNMGFAIITIEEPHNTGKQWYDEDENNGKWNITCYYPKEEKQRKDFVAPWTKTVL